MKMTEINENGSEISDLQSFKAKRGLEQKRQREKAIYDAISKLDHTVAATVDTLMYHGLSKKQSNDMVMNHLRDIILIHDLTGIEE